MRAGETPVPIPNTMVKTCTADDTMLETAWESRWMPESLFKKVQACKFFTDAHLLETGAYSSAG